MRFVSKIVGKLKDPNLSYEERTLIMLAVLGELSMVVGVIFDIYCGESIYEIVTLLAMMAAVPVRTRGLTLKVTM